MMEQNKPSRAKGEPPAPPGVNDFKRQARALGPLIDDPEALGQALAIVEAFEREERWTKTWRRFGLKP